MGHVGTRPLPFPLHCVYRLALRQVAHSCARRHRLAWGVHYREVDKEHRPCC